MVSQLLTSDKSVATSPTILSSETGDRIHHKGEVTSIDGGSQLKNYLVGINTKVIGKTDVKHLSSPRSWEPRRGSLKALAAHIGKGHPWMPAVLDKGRRRLQVFSNHAEVLAIDIDNSEKDLEQGRSLTIEQALEHPYIKAHAGLLIESASSTPEKHKYRVVFPLAAPLTSWRDIRLCNRFLAEKVGTADPACKDASRFFFGAPGRSLILLTENTLPDDFLQQAREWDVALQAKREKAKADREVAAARRREERSSDPTYQGDFNSDKDRVAHARLALSFVPPYSPGNGTYNDLITMCGGVINDLGAIGEQLLQEWNGFDCATDKTIRGLAAGSGSATLGSLFHLAKSHGFRFPKSDWNPGQGFGHKETRKDVTTIVNQRYLERIALPLLTSSVFASSPTGTGKTEILEDLVHQFLVMHPDGLADLIGYRNGLLVQTVLRIANKGRVNTVHKFNMEQEQAGWYGSKSLAYCVNSIDQRLDALNKAIDEGRKVLVILDEVGFIATHCFGMMNTQPKTGVNFAKLLRRIGEGHGYIVGLQANLSEDTIAFIQELTRKNFPLAIVRNEYKPPTWDVEMVEAETEPDENGVGKTLRGSVGVAYTAIEDLKAGKFILVTTAAQNFAEALDILVNGQGFKLLRVDAYTVAAAREAKKSNDTEEHRLIRQIFNEPKEAIERAKAIGYHGVILTPTAETGVSIDGVNFDHIIEYAPSGTSEAVLQRLARDRNNSTPRSIFTADIAADYRADVSSFPESVLKGWNLNKKQGFNAAGVLEVLNSEEQATYATEDDEILSIIARYAAQSVAAQNNDRRELGLNIARRLQEDGHSVKGSTTVVPDKFRDLWKTAQKTVTELNINLFAKAPMLPIDEAREVIKGGRATREKLYSAQKTIKLESYPGLNLDDTDLVHRLIFDKRGAALSYITQTWMIKNPAVAQQIDRACWKAQLGRGIVWAPSLKREALKSQTLTDTGILEILKLEEYCETTPEVMKLRAYCIQNNYQLRRVCGYAAAFDESHSGIRMVGWILGRLNYKQRVNRKQSVELKAGEKKEQVRYWKVIDLNKDDRTLVEAALAQKWETLEPLQDKEYTPDSHDFSVINQDRKIVTIPTKEPDEPKTYGLKLISELDDSDTYEYIPSPEEMAEWGIAA